MNHLNEQEIKELKECQTIGDQLRYLLNHFDLNIIPGSTVKTVFLTGMISAMDMIKPARKEPTIKRKRINQNESIRP